MTQTGVTSRLFSACRQTFFAFLPEDINKTIRESTDEPSELYAELQLIDTIGQAIDAHLGPDADSLLLALCQEDLDYFTQVSYDTSCITGYLTAAHVVYHLVYSDLHDYLETEWEEYVRTRREENPDASHC